MTASALPNQNSNPRDWPTVAAQLADRQLPDGWELVNSSGFARVAHNAEQRLFYKEFLPRSPLESVKAKLRGSRATRARIHNDELRLAGFKAPQNIAWGALSSGAEYLISTAVPGQGVDDWLRRQLPPGDPSLFKKRRQLLSDLGQAVGRLHHTGFVHGDMRTGNVLADYRGGRFHFAYIDNERNSRHKVAPGKFVARNLMQLNMHTPQELSRSERWVFFQAWRRQMRELSETEANVLARESFAWAMRRLAAKGKLVTSQ